MYNTPHAFSMPNPLKILHFKTEFSISIQIFLQKVAQKIEQKTAQQAHMTINQYLITKGTETTPLNPNSRRVNEDAKNHPPTRNRSLRLLHPKRLFPRGYRRPYGKGVGGSGCGL